MSQTLYAQLIGLSAGALLLTAVLLVWRRSLVASVRLLSAQGIALAALVAVIGVDDRDPRLLAACVLVLGLKGVVLPLVLARGVRAGTAREDSPRLNPTAALITASLLTILAYLVSRPLVDLGGDPARRAVPLGIALVMIGFLLLVTRRRARSQLVGFLVLDNGIAAVAFLTSGGVPLLVELGASLDVLLVVLILQVLTARMRVKFGDTDLDELRELHD